MDRGPEDSRSATEIAWWVSVDAVDSSGACDRREIEGYGGVRGMRRYRGGAKWIVVRLVSPKVTRLQEWESV